MHCWPSKQRPWLALQVPFMQVWQPGQVSQHWALGMHRFPEQPRVPDGQAQPLPLPTRSPGQQRPLRQLPVLQPPVEQQG